MSSFIVELKGHKFHEINDKITYFNIYDRSKKISDILEEFNIFNIFNYLSKIINMYLC